MPFFWKILQDGVVGEERRLTSKIFSFLCSLWIRSGDCESHSMIPITRHTIQRPLVCKHPSLLRLLIYSGLPFNLAPDFIKTERSFLSFLGQNIWTDSCRRVWGFCLSLHVSNYKKCSTAQLCEPTYSELFISVWSSFFGGLMLVLLSNDTIFSLI